MANEVDTLDRVAPYLGVAPQGTRPWNNQPSPRACFRRMHPLSGVAWLRTKDVPSSIPIGWYRCVFRTDVSHPCTIHPMLRRFWARADPSRHATSYTMPVPSNTTCASLVSSEKQRIFEASPPPLPNPSTPWCPLGRRGGGDESVRVRLSVRQVARRGSFASESTRVVRFDTFGIDDGERRRCGWRRRRHEVVERKWKHRGWKERTCRPRQARRREEGCGAQRRNPRT